MSFGVAAAIGFSYWQAEEARRRQESAANQAREDAKKQAEQMAKQQDEEFNRANPKRADVFGLLAKNMSMGQNGVGSTSLTGVGGVDPSQMLLGKNTLLGF